MKIAFFDTHEYDRNSFLEMNKKYNLNIQFFDFRLTEKTAQVAFGFECICAFVNDSLNSEVLKQLAANGTKFIALRSAGFNHVDLNCAKQLGLKIVRVPEYSPYAIAEHALSLIQTLNRKTHRAYNRVREGNFSLDGLVGFDLHGKTIGIIGTGKTGAAFARIMSGFQCTLLAFDLNPSSDLNKFGVKYTDLNDLLKKSDIISLHVPLNSSTKYLLNRESLSLTKKGVMIINTGRGALINTKDLIEGLKSNHIGSAGLDVYEEEAGVFFENHSEEILQDDQLARLLTFPNVLITSHQAFLTHEALSEIAKTTLENISNFFYKNELTNEVF